jgi:hypothetical protein
LVLALPSSLSWVWKQPFFSHFSHTHFKTTCGVYIIALGQWPAGWPGSAADTPLTYAEAMAKHLRAFKAHAGSDASIIVRAVHYNPIGENIGACPPKDWRHPILIDAYNAILAEVCRELNITFVDTNRHIVGPMWDSAEDWCHYKAGPGLLVGQVEAAFFARLVGVQVKPSDIVRMTLSSAEMKSEMPCPSLFLHLSARDHIENFKNRILPLLAASMVMYAVLARSWDA